MTVGFTAREQPPYVIAPPRTPSDFPYARGSLRTHVVGPHRKRQGSPTLAASFYARHVPLTLQQPQNVAPTTRTPRPAQWTWKARPARGTIPTCQNIPHQERLLLHMGTVRVQYLRNFSSVMYSYFSHFFLK